MALRTRVTTLLLMLFGAQVLIGLAIQRVVIYPSFLHLEREEAVADVDRALQTLQRELDLLSPSANDWGSWNDCYQYLGDRNQEFYDSNLNVESIGYLQVDRAAIYDLEGRCIWGVAVSPEGEQIVESTPALPATLPRSHPILADSTDRAGIAGVLPSPAGPLLVAAHPILTTEGEGPARGTMVMARLLDGAAIARIGAQARVELTGAPPVGGMNVALASAAGRAASGEHRAVPHAHVHGDGSAGAASIDLCVSHGRIGYRPIVYAETDEHTIGRTTVFDLFGNPILDLEIRSARAITARGQSALRYASLSLILGAGLVLLPLLVLLRRAVLDPVSKLTEHAIAVGTHDDLGVRLQLGRRDEIGTLAREFDQMVERLADTRRRLLDQSYESGLAEMASGVLHNIGNAATPLGVKLSTLGTELRQAPAAEMEMALAELDDPNTPPERRADLEEFVVLAGRELARLVAESSRELEFAREQVDLVQRILSDQQRFGRAPRVLEAHDLRGLVDETIRLLPASLRDPGRVVVDPALAAVGTVRTSRVAFHQVLANLLINAGESIHESGRDGDGRIRISASIEQIDSAAMVHLRVEDNGAGIAPETFPRIFERGFSTKSRGSGVGLHWSASAVSAMEGRLQAESEGVGRGATFHLFLPVVGASSEREVAA